MVAPGIARNPSHHRFRTAWRRVLLCLIASALAFRRQVGKHAIAAFRTIPMVSGGAPAVKSIACAPCAGSLGGARLVATGCSDWNAASVGVLRPARAQLSDGGVASVARHCPSDHQPGRCNETVYCLYAGLRSRFQPSCGTRRGGTWSESRRDFILGDGIDASASGDLRRRPRASTAWFFRTRTQTPARPQGGQGRRVAQTAWHNQGVHPRLRFGTAGRSTGGHRTGRPRGSSLRSVAVVRSDRHRRESLQAHGRKRRVDLRELLTRDHSCTRSVLVVGLPQTRGEQRWTSDSGFPAWS